MHTARVLLFVMAFLACAATHADDDVPILHRGINLSNWLANTPRQPLFDRDYMLLKDAGFDHVRLPFNPEYYGFKLDSIHVAQTMDFLTLDRAVGLATTNGLAVVLDIQPGDDFMSTIERDPIAEQRFIDFWVALATRYQVLPTHMLAFSLLGEPQYYGQEQHYGDFMRRLIKAVRTVAPSRLIIVSAPHGSSIDELTSLRPIDDPHVAYDFHFYEPYIITHQGITQDVEDTSARYFRHVPYPSQLVQRSAKAYTVTASTPLQAQSELNAYVRGHWDAEHIAGRIHMASHWAAKHHTHVFCGEFGVFRPHIDSDSRYRWIADVRKALEKDGIGWALYDYADVFGIAELHGKTETASDESVTFIDPYRGSHTLETPAYSALGLK